MLALALAALGGALAGYVGGTVFSLSRESRKKAPAAYADPLADDEEILGCIKAFSLNSHKVQDESRGASQTARSSAFCGKKIPGQNRGYKIMAILSAKKGKELSP